MSRETLPFLGYEFVGERHPECALRVVPPQILSQGKKELTQRARCLMAASRFADQSVPSLFFSLSLASPTHSVRATAAEFFSLTGPRVSIAYAYRPRERRREEKENDLAGQPHRV